jgi:hypothetical protein
MNALRHGWLTAIGLTLTAVCVFPQDLRAAIVTLEAKQTGGFYDGGATPNNDPAFQNYFVGYGTTPGFGRTAERRSFFWFDLSGLAPGTIDGATLHLTLPFGGLIFGKGPGDPTMGPVPDDPFEVFQLGATPVAPGVVTSPGLSPSEVMMIFDSFNDTPIADPLTFVSGGMPPPTDIAINPLGVSFLNFLAGSDIVLTGWMPTWSFDSRPDPMPPPDFFEASELIFGLTDVHSMAVPKPTLTISFTPLATVPEPSSLLLFVLGSACLGASARRTRVG